MPIIRRRAAERGFAMVETLVPLGIAGTVVTVGLTAISTGAITVGKTQALNKAQSTAAGQLEYVKGLAFVSGAATYATGVTIPSGLALSTTVSAVAGADSNVQKITVTVTHGAQTVATVEDLKVNRPL